MYMRVLEVFGEPISNGGQESFVINVVSHIPMDNLQIDFLTPYFCDNQYYRDIVEGRGGKIYSFDLPFNPGGFRGSIAKTIDEILRRNHYDVVHVHSGSISVLAIAAYAARKNHISKIIVHSHCASERATLKYRLVKILSSPIMALCPTDYCACSLVAGEWKFSKKIVKNKLVILKNGVDLNNFTPNEEIRALYRKKCGFKAEDWVIGHVGRFSYQKNHEYLIDIFAQLRKKSDRYKLLLIGSGENIENVKRHAESLGVLADICFAGNVNNVNDYMRAMDIFVLPSRFEGLPIVGVEAQAAGLPVVTSDQVSKELKLTEKVVYLSLNEKSEWVEAIENMVVKPRANNADVLKKAGYDINMTAGQIRKLYFER